MLTERYFQKEVIKKFIEYGFHFHNQEEDEFNNQSFSKQLLKNWLLKQYPSIDDNEISEIFQEINSNLRVGWYKNNRYGINHILKAGISTQKTKKNNLSPYFLIDKKNIRNNDFRIAEEVWICSGSRMDTVILLNGLPIFLFEFKSFSTLNYQTDLKTAINQINRYSGDSDKIFTFNIACIAMNAYDNAKIGSPNLEEEFWFNIIPSDSKKLNDFFNFFSKSKIIGYLFSGLLFSKGSNSKKYILRHHQWDAVDAIISSLIKNEGGYIWHTQGSGKTITMSSLISRLHNTDGLSSMTVIIDVDRKDLVDNIFSQLKELDEVHLSGTELKRADSREDLKGFLSNKVHRGVIVTTTQKFEDWNKISDRDDLLVISDEAHRSHSEADINDVKDISKKSYYQKIKESLPNAKLIGFTGTPIFNEYKPTFKSFGDCLHMYNMKNAEDDQIITKIRYSRYQIPLVLNNEKIKDLDRNRKIKDKSKLIDESPDRLQKIANEIERSFRNSEYNHKNIEGNKDTFKAMVVTNRVSQGYKLLKLLRDSNITDNKEDIQFVATKQESNQEIEVYEYLKKQKNEDIYNSFKKSNSNIKILIVTSMLLTGYDVPNLRIMYIDKEIKEHNLLQTIARVNRRFPNKTEGYIIAFRKLDAELEKALHVYRNTTGDFSNQILLYKDLENNIEKQLSLIESYGIKIENQTNNEKYNISFYLNEISFKIKNDDYQNKEKILSCLDEIYKSMNSISSWKNDDLKIRATYCKIIYRQIKRSDYENLLISVSDKDFIKILNSITVDSNNIFYVIDNLPIETIFNNKNASRNILIDQMSKKLNRNIRFDKSLTLLEKNDLIKEIENIINSFNKKLTSYDDIIDTFKNIEGKISKYNNFSEFTKILIQCIKNTMKSDFTKIDINENKLKEMDKFLSSNRIGLQLQTTYSSKHLKNSLRDKILNDFGIDKSIVNKIVLDFADNIKNVNIIN